MNKYDRPSCSGATNGIKSTGKYDHAGAIAVGWVDTGKPRTSGLLLSATLAIDPSILHWQVIDCLPHFFKHFQLL